MLIGNYNELNILTMIMHVSGFLFTKTNSLNLFYFYHPRVQMEKIPLSGSQLNIDFKLYRYSGAL